MFEYLFAQLVGCITNGTEIVYDFSPRPTSSRQSRRRMLLSNLCCNLPPALRLLVNTGALIARAHAEFRTNKLRHAMCIVKACLHHHP